MRTSVLETLTKVAAAGGVVPAERAEATPDEVLAQAALTEPTYVEKLASAVDFAVGNLFPGMANQYRAEEVGRTKLASVESSLGTQSGMRAALDEAKIKLASAPAESAEFIASLVGKMKLASAAAAYEQPAYEQPAYEEPAGDIEPFAGEEDDDIEELSEEEPSQEDLEGLSLSHLLEGVLDRSDRKASLDDQAETGTVREDETGNETALELMRKRLRLVVGGKTGEQ